MRGVGNTDPCRDLLAHPLWGQVHLLEVSKHAQRLLVLPEEHLAVGYIIALKHIYTIPLHADLNFSECQTAIA
jgi:hypothetical protein